MKGFVWAAVCLLWGAAGLGAQTASPRPPAFYDSSTGRLVVEVRIDQSGIVDPVFLNRANRPNLEDLGNPDQTDLLFINGSQTLILTVQIGNYSFELPPLRRHGVPLRDAMAALNGQADKRFVLLRPDKVPLPQSVGHFALNASTATAPASAAAAEPGQPGQPGQPVGIRDTYTHRDVVSITVREDGIRRRAFLNSLNPPVVAYIGDEDFVDLQFQNESQTTQFRIRIGGQRVLLAQGSQASVALQDVLASLTPYEGGLRGQFVVLDGDGNSIPDGTGYFVVRRRTEQAPAAGPARVVQNFQMAPESLGQTPPVQAEQVPPPPPPTSSPESRTAHIIRSAVKGAAAPEPVTQPPPADPTPIVPAPERDRVVQIPLNGVGVDDWEFRNLRNPPYLLKAARDEDGDALGAAFRQYLQAAAAATTTAGEVRDAIVDGIAKIDRAKADAEAKGAAAAKALGVSEATTRPENPWARLALLYSTDIEFVNDAIDRTFTIGFEIPTPARIADPGVGRLEIERAEFEAKSGLKLGDCGKETCKVLLNLPYKSPRRFGIRFLAGTAREELLDFLTWDSRINQPQPAVTFTVSLFDEAATPAEGSAYISLVPLSLLREAASKTTWTLSPTVGASYEPLVADTDTFANDDRRFPGDVRRVLTGVARLRLQQHLGSRADGTVEFAFKGGVLGEKGYTGSVTTPSYQINVNSIPGIRLSFGKFLFAQPTNAIALREFGEGFRLSARNKAAFSYVVKRESVDGVPDTGNRDNKVFLFELNNVVGRRWSSVRGLNVIGSYGRDSAAKTKHQYWTAGVDVQYSVPDSAMSGTAAYYHSDRKPLGAETNPLIVRGKGDVGFATFGYTFFRKPTSPTQPTQKVAASIRGEWGMGSGDRRSSINQDESYLGETSAFAPDNFFLKIFADKLVTGPDKTSLRIGGLRNKQYFAGVYQEERFTPLELIAKLLTVPKSDIGSRLLVAGVRKYHFRGDIFEGHDKHNGGHELFFESTIETPPGVKASLNMNYFRPGNAIRDFFKNESIWSVVAKLTVSLGS